MGQPATLGWFRFCLDLDSREQLNPDERLAWVAKPGATSTPIMGLTGLVHPANDRPEGQTTRVMARFVCNLVSFNVRAVDTPRYRQLDLQLRSCDRRLGQVRVGPGCCTLLSFPSSSM